MIELKRRRARAERTRAAARRVRGEVAPSNKERPDREQRGTLDRRLPGIDAPRLDDLGVTRRELAVLELVAQGRTNEEIGEALGLSPLTVKKHLERMSLKLGAANRAALVALTWQRSSVPPGTGKRGRQTRL